MYLSDYVEMDQMAHILGVHYETLRRWVHDDEKNIPYKKIGKKYMFKPKDVIDSLDSE